jgi:hypothetical protein
LGTNTQTKRLCDLTPADVQALGYRSLGAFVDAWLDKYGYWDPYEVFDGEIA